MIIEVIVTSVEEAVLAAGYGANRLELIHDFEWGGLSPKLEVVKEVCNSVKIPVNVMLRPHADSFIYDTSTVEQIMQELDLLQHHTNARGIVFGALTNEGHIDTKLVETIIKHKGNLNLVFNRAIDETADILAAFEQLLNFSQIDTVLSSGGMPTALNGIAVIKQMVELSAKLHYCEVMAGSGITPDNAYNIIQSTGIRQIHLGTGLRTNGVLDKTKFDKLLSAINGYLTKA